MATAALASAFESHEIFRVFPYSKMSQAGIAAVSYLAAHYQEGRLVGSAEIAGSRQLSRHLTAKVLTLLSQADLLAGTPGPSGGYKLRRPPGEITLLDVVRVFENPDRVVMCPFGPDWCGIGKQCPLHDTILRMQGNALDELTRSNFAPFELPGNEGRPPL